MVYSSQTDSLYHTGHHPHFCWLNHVKTVKIPLKSTKSHQSRCWNQLNSPFKQTLRLKLLKQLNSTLHSNLVNPLVLKFNPHSITLEATSSSPSHYDDYDGAEFQDVCTAKAPTTTWTWDVIAWGNTWGFNLQWWYLMPVIQWLTGACVRFT